MSNIIQTEAGQAMTAWQKLGAKNQAFIEGAAVLVLGGAGDTVVHQLQTGVFDGPAVVRALEIGVGLGLAWVLAYLRGHITGLMTPTPPDSTTQAAPSASLPPKAA